MDLASAEDRIQEQVLIAQVDVAIKKLEISERKLIEVAEKDFQIEKSLIQLRFKVQRDKLLKTLEEVLILVTNFKF
jgi:hypothetical protein